MNNLFVSHMLPTEDLMDKWRSLLSDRQQAIYETYLRFYLLLQDQLNTPVDHPTTFGFYFNTPLSENSKKTGALFHKANLKSGGPLLHTSKFVKQRIAGQLDDLGLDFMYQRKIDEIVQKMPGENNYMFVYLYDTPHSFMDDTHRPTENVGDMQQQLIFGHEFYKLCDRNDNKVFAIP